MTTLLSRDQAATAVAAAVKERDTIQANLLELDNSFGKRLLAGATLTGGTRKRWDAAAADLTTLWQTFDAYSAVVDRAAELASRLRRSADRELAEISSLLYGTSVQLNLPSPALARGDLTGTGTSQVTLAAAVADMRRAFAAVTAVVTAAEAVWNEVADDLQQLGDQLAAARQQLGGLDGDALGQALTVAEEDHAQLRGVLNGDPLALWQGGQVDTTRIVRLRERTAAAVAAVGRLAALRADADARVAAVAATVSAAGAARQDAMAARDRAAAKIATAALPAPPELGALTARLAGAGELKAAGRWTRLASELDLIEGQAADVVSQCREVERRAAALLDRREELRGLLDAYQARATRLGGAEDTDLDARYARARELLWTAPCDLPAATAAVTGYQQAVLALSGRGEAAMTSTVIKCTRPGCGGTIDGGYCDACGLAPDPVQPAAPVGSAPSSASATFSGSGGTGTAGTGSGRTGSGSGSRRTRAGITRSSRGHLGAGLVDIPPVPARDPASAVLADPLVAENKRFCGACDRPVGRGKDGQPGLVDGFCPHCGTPFSFVPKLEPGEMVAGQYEVLGCLAHGGLGWIYLAMDHNLGKRWVVLKGLLNTGDAAAQEAAVAERRFLAEVEHPSIVDIYNFVQHADRKSGQSAGYIVMEYVGGKSLRQILQERRQMGQSLPLPMALAYAIEVLPALGYLHSRGLVYCDFKPDNVIQTEEQLKIIDMGGVRRIDDDDSAIYGTVGYQAPEIASLGPSVSSDLYTVGRALAVMTFEFAGYQGRYATSLPDPASVPLLATQESFLRALRRATDPDPDRRFASAGEMADQLTGVLREVLAVADGRPRPAFSTLFSPELQAAGVAEALADGSPAAHHPPTAAEIVAGLPVPQVDAADPAAGYLATLSTLDPGQRTAVLAAAVAGDQGTPQEVARSAETRLALARSRIVTGDPAGAGTVLADLAAEDPADWRIAWYHGLRELATGNPAGARAAFDAVAGALPGELAAKLALGFAAEAAGDQVAADHYFQLVWTVDHAYIGAVFGLARTRLAAGDPAAAIAALAAVPDTSSHYLAAQVTAVRIQVSPRAGQAQVAPDDLGQAGARVDRLKLDAIQLEYLTAEVLRAALGCAQAGGKLPGGAVPGRLLGCEFTERGLRFGLERSYRAQARLAPARHRRIELVEAANSVRPRTWV